MPGVPKRGLAKSVNGSGPSIGERWTASWRGAILRVRHPPGCWCISTWSGQQPTEARMKISILGGGGFLGRKVAARLARDGKLGGQPITGLTLFDLAEPPKPDAAFPVTAVAGDIVELPDSRHSAGHRRDLPPRRRRVGTGRGRLRPRAAGEPARHRRRRGRLPPPGRKRAQAAARGVHLVRGHLLRRTGRQPAGRCAAGADQQLWCTEGRSRADPWRCLAPRIPRRWSRSGCPR